MGPVLLRVQTFLSVQKLNPGLEQQAHSTEVEVTRWQGYTCQTQGGLRVPGPEISCPVSSCTCTEERPAWYLLWGSHLQTQADPLESPRRTLEHCWGVGLWGVWQGQGSLLRYQDEWPRSTTGLRELDLSGVVGLKVPTPSKWICLYPGFLPIN